MIVAPCKHLQRSAIDSVENYKLSRIFCSPTSFDCTVFFQYRTPTCLHKVYFRGPIAVCQTYETGGQKRNRVGHKRRPGLSKSSKNCRYWMLDNGSIVSRRWVINSRWTKHAANSGYSSLTRFLIRWSRYFGYDCIQLWRLLWYGKDVRNIARRQLL